MRVDARSGGLRATRFFDYLPPMSGAREDETKLSSHFAFGENWAEYAKEVGEGELERAQESLLRLLTRDQIKGARILDIGSGSGLFSAAALSLDAREVVAIDLDPDSVATTQATLHRFHPEGPWRAEQRSVFDLDGLGAFDIVYSWGVLHHTGAMHRAIRCAAAAVRPGGRLVLALYRRTALCGFWRQEKRFYKDAPRAVQKAMQRLYLGLFTLGLWVTARTLNAYKAKNRRDRGMNFGNDIHDWLGGYPYESISADALDRFLRGIGFTPERVFARPGGLGLLGSGCDEFVYVRTA